MFKKLIKKFKEKVTMTYIVTEETTYFPLIEEYTNCYSVHKKKLTMFGEVTEPVESGFVNADQAIKFAQKLVKAERFMSKEGVRVIFETDLEENV